MSVLPVQNDEPNFVHLNKSVENLFLLFDNLFQQKMLKRIIGKGSFIKEHIVFYRSLYDDPRVPRAAKWLLWSAICYTLLPFDLIPDFVPVIGQLDDIVIVSALLWLAIRMIPKGIYEEHHKRIFGELRSDDIQLWS